VLPAFRAIIAKELIEKYEFSQMDAAKKLGTTQATINHYVYSKRGEKKLKQLESILDVKRTAEEIAYEIAYEQISTTDAITKFCRLCQKIRKEMLLCTMHRDAVPYNLENCNICPDIPS
jgi:predicted transcriptional regulator